MAQQYAKDQPKGFVNRIERVAIVGAGGTVGRPITEALVKAGKHAVTAITRINSPNKLPDGVKVAAVDYDDEESLVKALKGQQFFIITMNSSAAGQEAQGKLIKAAAKACVPYVMPNDFGWDSQDKRVGNENLVNDNVRRGIDAVEREGVSAWVAMVNGFWYEFSLAGTPWSYGFDWKNKKVTFFDDGKTAINTSTWLRCGEAAAAFLSLKLLPEDENDKSPTISQWRNKALYISSFTASQRDMLDSINRVAGMTDKDWDISYETVTERYERGLQLLKKGEREGFITSMYTRMFFPDGAGDFGAEHGLANEALGLPEEDIDEASKRAIGMWEKASN